MKAKGKMKNEKVKTSLVEVLSFSCFIFSF